MMRKNPAAVIRAIALIVIVITLCSVADTNMQNYTIWNDHVSSDVVRSDGTREHGQSNVFSLLNRGDQVTIHVSLPESQHREHAVLCFYVYHSVIHAYCNGKEIYSFGEELAQRGSMIGAEFTQITVPEEAWGTGMDLVFDVQENNAFSQIRSFQMYSAKDAYRYFFNKGGLALLLVLFQFFFAVIVLGLVILPLRNRTQIKNGIYVMACAGLMTLYVFTSCGWYCFFGYAHFWAVAEYVSLFCAPIPLCLYMAEQTASQRQRNVLRGCAAATGLLAGIATVLNYMNWMHYCDTLPAAHVLIVVCGIAAACAAADRQYRNQHSSGHLLTGMILTILFCFLDIARYNITKYVPHLNGIQIPSILPIGTMIFLTFLMWDYLEQLWEQRLQADRNTQHLEHLRKLVAAIPAGICVFRMDETGEILEANELFYLMFGCTREEAEQQKIRSIFDPMPADTQHELRKKMQQLVAGKLPKREIELTIADRDGQQRFLVARDTIDTQMNEITISINDITERKRIAEKLRISEDSYRMALRQSGKAFFYFDVPKRTMYLSDELAERFGLPSIVDDMPENLLARGLIKEESMADCREFYRQIYRGEPYGSAVLGCRSAHDAAEVWWYQFSFSTVFSDEKKPISALVIYEDRTEQRNLEEAYQRASMVNRLSEEHYAVYACNLTQNRVEYEEGGVIAPLLTHSSRELTAFLRYAADQMICAEDREAFAEFTDVSRLRALYEGGTQSDAIRLRYHDGETLRWFELRVQLVQDPHFGDLKAFATCENLDEERRAMLQRELDMQELKRELENSRIKIMMTQMQPHFLYNALSAIQTIIKIDPDYAYDLLFDFTTHLRSTVRGLSSDEPILFEEELKNIRAYLNIEQMRFGDALHICYDIGATAFRVVPLSIQPIAENAARHGIYPKGNRGGTIIVRSYETEQSFIVEVEDDGVGFDPETVLRGTGDSVGLKNLIYRLRTLMDAEVSIHSRIGEGTKVTVTIPRERGESREYEDNHGG